LVYSATTAHNDSADLLATHVENIQYLNTITQFCLIVAIVLKFKPHGDCKTHSYSYTFVYSKKKEEENTDNEDLFNS